MINCFGPYKLRTGSNVNAMLFLDNCSAYTLSDKEKSKLTKRVFVLFLSPNMTNAHQPADMVMIFRIKDDFRLTLLKKLLSIFDIKGGYQRAYDKRKQQNSGYEVIDFVGKPHLPDAMRIQKTIWEGGEGKYSRVGEIKCYW